VSAVPNLVDGRVRAAKKKGSLKRVIVPMPSDVRRLLQAKGLWGAYQARPAYQQNDYLGWMSRAKLPETRQKRLLQMLDELERGDVYMKMKWRPRTVSVR
jgi:uncharacterized protein YdeI (YjbR/CyaY-like superfamily)